MISASTTVALDFFGQRVSIAAGDLADAVRQLWRPFLTESARADETKTTEITVPDLGTDQVRLGWLNSALNSAAMQLTPNLAVHAGVVRNGDVVVAFPAKSGVGKSTLTGACLRQGFDYVSDEALCLGYDDGLISPYPRPLGLSTWSAHLLAVTGPHADDDVLVVAADLEATSVTVDERLRLTHVVLLNRAEGAAGSVVSTPRHAAIEALLRMSFNHYLRPAEAVRLVTATVAATEVHTLTYDSATDAASVLTRTFAAAGLPLLGEITHP